MVSLHDKSQQSYHQIHWVAVAVSAIPMISEEDKEIKNKLLCMGIHFTIYL